MEAIKFPDVEALLVVYLNGLLAEPVSTKVPSPRPATFVRIIRTGGFTTGLVTDEALITFEAWAATEPAAQDLAQRVRAYLRAVDVVDGVQFYGPINPTGPVNLPDPATQQARYTGLVSVGVRGSAI
jgi:hypothetical protein